MENKSRYLKYGLHAAIIIGLVWAAVKYVNGQEVLKALQNFKYSLLPFMLALSLVFFLLKAWRFAILMGPFAENLSQIVVYKAYLSGQAATLLPGGIAARAGLLKQVGVPVSESSVPVIVHSGWDQAVFLTSALLAALWFPVARLPVFIILGVLVVVVLLLIIAPTRNFLANLAERLARRFKYEDQWHHFLNSVPKVFTLKIMLASLLITVASLAIFIFILYLTLQGFELSASFPTLFLAVVLPTMLGRIFPVPGGIGVTEASMVGFLTSLAQLDTDTTVAAVALFRVVMIVFPAALGALIYFIFWRGEEETKDRRGQTKPSREAPHASPSDI